MRKLSEYVGEDALDLLAELIEPAIHIMQDEELQSRFGQENVVVADIASLVVKRYKKDILKILTLLSEEADYNPNIFVLLKDVIDLFNDEELIDFFNSQVQMTESESFGLATENTEADVIG